MLAGIIIPYEAAIAAGSTKTIGLKYSLVTSINSNGSTIAALAVLLINSVRIIPEITMIHINTIIGTKVIRTAVKALSNIKIRTKYDLRCSQ